MKKRILTLMLMAILTIVLAGCGSTAEKTSDNGEADKATDLSGKTLQIYCGAGMTNPFQEIADAFKAETGCEINVTFANAGQIQSQINTSKQGDIFIAGSADELEPVSTYVAEKVDLVKHIPVLAVAEGNPKAIHGLADLANKDVELILGDMEATPIGKIAKKALSEAGIFDSVHIVATTTTAPQLATTIAAGEADAAIVWKENCEIDGVEVVKTTDLDKYVKTVPAAILNLTKDQETVDEFMAFLDTDTAKNIWIKYGYENLK